MNYSLFKLRFITPVHFGTPDSALSLYGSEDHFLADTLFSAFCHEALSLWGEDGLQELIGEARQGHLLLSDSMPWKGDSFYLPRPCVNGSSPSEDLSAQQRKDMKRLRWIPLESLEAFSHSIKTGERFRTETVEKRFGEESEMTRVHITGLEIPRPFQVGTFRFAENCGLYFIAGYSDSAMEERLRVLTEAAGLSGIGGRISSGLGKFRIEDCLFLNEPFDSQTEMLFGMLSAAESGRHLLLTSSLPEEDLDCVIDGASFRLVRRGGFIGSSSFAESPRKKKTEYYLAAGSVLPRRFRGSLRSAAEGGNHPVYRFNQPVFLGVNL